MASSLADPEAILAADADTPTLSKSMVTSNMQIKNQNPAAKEITMR